MILKDKAVEKAKSGDNKALEKLYRDNFTSLFKFVRYKVSSTEVAEDITAEAFIKAFENISKFNEQSSFKSWVYTIAKNLIIDWYKVKSKHFDGSTELIEDFYQVSSGFEADESNKTNYEIEISVKETLSKLPGNYRQVLELRFLLNFSIKETAVEMKITEGNVKVLQNRALKKAKELSLKK